MPISPTPPSGTKTSSSRSLAMRHRPRRRRRAEMHVAGGDRLARAVVARTTTGGRPRRWSRSVPRRTLSPRLTRDRLAEARGAGEPARADRGEAARRRPRRAELLGPGVARAPRTASRRRPATPQRGEARSPDRAGPSGCATTVDADADRRPRAGRRRACSPSSRMPASLAPSSSTSFGHFSARRSAAPPPSRPMRPSVGATARVHRERQPGDEAERRGDAPARRRIDEQQAWRRDCPRGVAQARPRRPRPAVCSLRDDPEVGRDRPPRARASASALVEPTVVEGLEAVAAPRGRGRASNAIASEEGLGGELRGAADRAGDEDEEQDEGAADAEHDAQLDRPSARSRRPARRNT